MNTRTRPIVLTIAFVVSAAALCVSMFTLGMKAAQTPEPSPTVTTSSICTDAAEALDAAAKGLIAASAPVILDGQDAVAARDAYHAAVGVYEDAYFGPLQQCRDEAAAR